jgi:hypothetical protein
MGLIKKNRKHPSNPLSVTNVTNTCEYSHGELVEPLLNTLRYIYNYQDRAKVFLCRQAERSRSLFNGLNKKNRKHPSNPLSVTNVTNTCKYSHGELVEPLLNTLRYIYNYQDRAKVFLCRQAERSRSLFNGLNKKNRKHSSYPLRVTFCKSAQGDTILENKY